MIVDVLQFVATGKFGPMELGISIAALHAVAGKPDSKTTAGMSPEMQRFGRLQVQVRNQTVHSILLNTARLVRPPYPKIVYQNLDGFLESKIADATALVTAAGLSVVVDSTTTSALQTTLVVPQTGVHLAFNEGLLDRVYVSHASFPICHQPHDV